MSYTKRILATVALLSITSTLFAGSEGGSGYTKPIETSKFGFSAVLDGSKVNMTWSKFSNVSNEGLTYYKVVRSSKNANPVYPDDGYIKYDTSMDFTSYTDYDAPQGTSYYRVCAITEKKNRYCSNVVKIQIGEKKTEEPKVGMANPASVNCKKLGGESVPMKDEKGNEYAKCKLPDGRVCEEWKLYRGECEAKKEEPKKDEPKKQDDGIMKKVDQLVMSFDKKLGEKYGTDNASKIQLINAAITKLTALKDQKPSMTHIIDPLVARLKQLATKYADTSEIENILDVK